MVFSRTSAQFSPKFADFGRASQISMLSPHVRTTSATFRRVPRMFADVCGQNSQFSGVAANSNNRNVWRPFGVRTCCSTFRLMRAHVMIYMAMHTLWPEVYLGGWLSDAGGAEGVTIRIAPAAPRAGLVLLHASSPVLCRGWMESQSG